MPRARSTVTVAAGATPAKAIVGVVAPVVAEDEMSSPVAATATSIADGRSAGFRAVIARSRATQSAPSDSGMSGSRTRRAPAASTAGPGNAVSPVRASSTRRPSAYTSAAEVGGWPLTCSGLR